MTPTTNETQLTVADLKQFTGSENWYRHEITSRLKGRDITYTDGVRYMAETGDAYWLIDLILLNALLVDTLRNEEFQAWDLTVYDDKSALVTCENGNGGELFRHKIETTDFPLNHIRLFYINDVLHLPSEY